jgi:cytochrome c peroxidase
MDSATPPWFGKMPIPADNAMTREGVALGRKLFHDPIISGDNTMSCASCHQQEFGFTDGGKRFSKGIHGTEGTRNSMTLFNVGYGRQFFWDGRSSSLEDQALRPIQDPTELDETLPSLIAELQVHPEYPDMFKKAFGTSTVTPDLIAKAIAQFERALISGNSLFDKDRRGEGEMSDDAVDGFQLIIDPLGADCFHCHADGNMLWGNFDSGDPRQNFENNGLDSVFTDLGRGQFTGDSTDFGRFKTASLRNIMVTAPYMHDGRFATIEEVIDHYSEGLVPSPNQNPANLQYVPQGGVQLTATEKMKVIEFLKALTDTSALTNPAFGPP